jgi:hypothetical protein
MRICGCWRKFVRLGLRKVHKGKILNSYSAEDYDYDYEIEDNGMRLTCSTHGKLSNAHNWVGRFERNRQPRRHCSE